MELAEGYTKEVLRDLTVNSWRPVLIGLVIFVVLLVLMITQVASPLFGIVLIATGIYLVASIWAAAGYWICRRPDGGLPKARGSLLLSVVVLLLPRELLH